VPWIAADITRIGRALNWAPRYDLAAATRATWLACADRETGQAAGPAADQPVDRVAGQEVGTGVR
jgi:hypothetical protein